MFGICSLERQRFVYTVNIIEQVIENGESGYLNVILNVNFLYETSARTLTRAVTNKDPYGE